MLGLQCYWSFVKAWQQALLLPRAHGIGRSRRKCGFWYSSYVAEVGFGIGFADFSPWHNNLEWLYCHLLETASILCFCFENSAVIFAFCLPQFGALSTCTEF